MTEPLLLGLISLGAAGARSRRSTPGPARAWLRASGALALALPDPVRGVAGRGGASLAATVVARWREGARPAPAA